MVPLLRMPPIEDEAVLEILSDYVSKNTKIYNQVLKLESYLETEFVLPNNLTYADRCVMEKVLSVFEPVEVEDTIWNLNLQINCDRQLYESLKKRSNHPMEIIEGIEENIYLFGQKYFIKEQRITIPCPVIENIDEVRNTLLSGNKAIAKIVSSTGKLTLRCKM